MKAQCNVDIIDSTIYKIEKLPSIVFNNIFSFKATGSPITKLISIRPLPLCNLYQHNPYKFNLEKNIHVELVTDADTTNAFLRQTITDGGRLNKLNNQGLICTDVCVVQPHKVTVDFKKIKRYIPMTPKARSTRPTHPNSCPTLQLTIQKPRQRQNLSGRRAREM